MLVETQQASANVVRLLTELIRESNLSPGDRLPGIRELSQRWQIGRNAVRDGLLHAQTMGLVHLEPRSGAYVQKANYSSLADGLARTLEIALAHEDSTLFDLIEARRVIEVEMVKQAAERCRPEELMPMFRSLQSAADLKCERSRFIALDEDFHLAIAQSAGNKVLLTLLRAVLIMLRPFRSTLVPDEEKWSRINRTHQDIYRHLLDRDVAGVQRAMNEHLSDQREQALARMHQIS